MKVQELSKIFKVVKSLVHGRYIPFLIIWVSFEHHFADVSVNISQRSSKSLKNRVCTHRPVLRCTYHPNTKSLKGLKL